MDSEPRPTPASRAPDQPGNARTGNERTLAAAAQVLDGTSRGSWYRRLAPFLGPAFIASVAYMDPGNFATNIQGGAQFGYMLLWVIVASNLMAMLIQTLSAKLGIATGKNLAEHCRDQFPRWAVWSMWVLMEVVAMATDLAEFLGAALGFNLLFGMPLFVAGLADGVATFAILALERYGFRPLEAVITSLVGRHRGLLPGRDDPGPARLGPDRLPRGRAAVPRDGERAPGHRHPGRHGDAARDLPALGAHPGPHRGARPGTAAAAVPLSSSWT